MLLTHAETSNDQNCSNFGPEMFLSYSDRKNLIIRTRLMNCLKSEQTSPLGVFVFSPSSTNVTVMFPSGAGVEVRLREGTMTTTVLLPEEFKDSTVGLLGKMNGDAGDDLVLSNGELVRNLTNPEELFSFGASCKKLFTMQIRLRLWRLCSYYYVWQTKPQSNDLNRHW